MKRIGRPVENIPMASDRHRSITSRTSFTPDVTALRVKNGALVALARMRANVVLPTPGGPHRMNELTFPVVIMRRNTPFSPTRWVWPM